MKTFKKLFCMALVAGMVFPFAACGHGIDDPETAERKAEVSEAKRINRSASFELGFLENVEGRDLSAFGAENYRRLTNYYDTKYGDVSTASSKGIVYGVSAYPDYADGGSFVTQIRCADPDAKFLGGFTISDTDRLADYLTQIGYTVQKNDRIYRAKKGRIEIDFDSLSVDFIYDVSDRNVVIID